MLRRGGARVGGRRRRMRLARWGLAGLLCVAGCARESNILIEFDGDTPTFIVDQPSLMWGVPPARINALAVASEDEAFWQIETVDPNGMPMGGGTITYGQVPEGFEQVTPARGGRARDLRPGVTYYVGATGPDDATWRAIFALPVGRFGLPPKPEFGTDAPPAQIDVSKPDPDAKIAD